MKGDSSSRFPSRIETSEEFQSILAVMDDSSGSHQAESERRAKKRLFDSLDDMETASDDSTMPLKRRTVSASPYSRTPISTKPSGFTAINAGPFAAPESSTQRTPLPNCRPPLRRTVSASPYSRAPIPTKSSGFTPIYARPSTARPSTAPASSTQRTPLPNCRPPAPASSPRDPPLGHSPHAVPVLPSTSGNRLGERRYQHREHLADTNEQYKEARLARSRDRGYGLRPDPLHAFELHDTPSEDDQDGAAQDDRPSVPLIVVTAPAGETLYPRSARSWPPVPTDEESRRYKDYKNEQALLQLRILLRHKQALGEPGPARSLRLLELLERERAVGEPGTPRELRLLELLERELAVAGARVPDTARALRLLGLLEREWAVGEPGLVRSLRLFTLLERERAAASGEPDNSARYLRLGRSM